MGSGRSGVVGFEIVFSLLKDRFLRMEVLPRNFNFIEALSKVVKGIHGEDGNLDKQFRNHHPSLWLDIVKEVHQLQNCGIDLLSFMHRKIGNGENTRFWEDNCFFQDSLDKSCANQSKHSSLKVKLDGLPTRLNISKRGYEEWLEWLMNVHLHSNHKKLLEGVCYVMWWFIWNFRNKSIFGSSHPSKVFIFDEVVARSFLWVTFNAINARRLPLALPVFSLPIPVLPVPPKGQANPLDVVSMLLIMDPYIQKNLEHLGVYDMLEELKRFMYNRQISNFFRPYENYTRANKKKDSLYMSNLCLQKKLHLLAIRAGRIHKNQKKKSHKAAKGNQGKGKAKMNNSLVPAPSYALKAKNPPTPKKDNHEKDAICHQCGEVGHWRSVSPKRIDLLCEKLCWESLVFTSYYYSINLVLLLEVTAEGNKNATNPPPVPPTPQALHTLSTIKLFILKKGEYDIWAMKMEHYLGHTDYPIWEVKQKGNGHVQVSTDTHGHIRVLPPKTAEETLARERERKARTTLIMAIPEDHLANFHKMTDAKEMWEAIKSRFGGNDESKKMQKYILKQQFEGFFVSNSEGLHKGYYRFQILPSQLEIHGAGVSTENANYKFLRVFESDVKCSTASSSSIQNVAFVSSDSTNNTNEVSTAYGVSTSFGHNSQKEGSSSYTDELVYSFFANQSSGLDLKDLEHIDEFDLEEMDLKWQVAMISTRLKKFYKKTGRNCNLMPRNQLALTKLSALIAIIHGTLLESAYQKEIKKTGHAEDDTEDYALMAFNSSNSGSDTKMSAKDKFGLGYGNQIHDGVLSYENEVLESVFDSRSSDVEDSHVNDRFAKVKGMHAVPPLMTGNYMPPKSDFGIDESKFTYGPKQSKTIESKPKAVSEPKVWSDAPIIKEYESDSDDEYVFKASIEQEKPSCAFINIVKHVKTPRQTTKDQDTCSQNPKVDKRDWTGLKSKRMGLEYGYTKKACFVCGSFSHLIRDCDFHEKRMAKQVELNKSMNKDNPHQTLKGKGIIDSGCSRHMTRNKAYLVDYQDFNGGLVAFGGSKGQITDTECLVLSPNFKLPDENQVLLKVPRQNNIYSFNLENIVPSRDLACLIAKATVDESNKWHMRLVMKATKGLLFSCVFFLRTKDETSKILKDFIRQIENHLNQKVKTIRRDNGTEFKNRDIIEFCGSKGIKREYKNKANKIAGPKKANNSAGTQANIDSEIKAEHASEYFVLPLWSSYTLTVKSSEAKIGNDKLNEDIGLKTHKEPIDQEDQAFLVELKRLKRLGKKANDAAETLRKTFAHSTEDLLLQAGAARASNTNYVNTASTPVNAASTLIEPKKISQVLKDESWVDAMQEDLLQFKTQQVWILVDLPFGKKVIGTKWVYKNKKDERGVAVRNKARLVAQGHRKVERIDYNEFSAHVARIEAIAIFLAFASYMGFIVYQMDVKSAFLYGKIDEENDKKDIMLVQVYVDDIIFGSTKKSCCDEFEALMKNRFQTSSMGGLTFCLVLQVKQKEDGIFISQEKYVAEILKKFDFISVKTASTPIETKKPLVKDEKAVDVDVHLYRSMIGSLMYLTASRPDIMRLISWQCKKKTIVATSTIEAKYVASANCCGQVLWIQNQMHHFIRDAYEKKLIQVLKIHTDDNVADLLTKAFDVSRMGYEKPFDKLTFYKAFFSPQWKFMIHTILQCLTAKTTSWNEFSSTMASAIIYLATNQKFNFSRYILLSLVKNIEADVPFFIIPRFVQLIINHQLGDMTHHKEIFDTPLLTKQVFANMKSVGTGFSREVTPLFANMLVQASEEVAKHTLPLLSHDPLPSGEDNLKLKELMDLCTNLSNKVLGLESEVINIKYTYQERIEKLESMVERLEEENKMLNELKSVHFTVDSDESVMEKEQSSKQGRKIVDIDVDIEINLEKAQAQVYNLDLDHQEKVFSMLDVNDEEPADVEEVLEVVKAARLITKVVTTDGATKLDEEVARQLEAELNADINWNAVIEQGKKSERLTDAKALIREGESLEQEIAKKQNMEQETEELKKHLQIVPDDDDVYTDATPLALKILIVDYKIHTKRNRPYFKIIKADGNHMLFISFITMMKNFDREDLESLWKIIFLLVERMYPLTHFALKQMINDIRLEVEDESEMSLELLRLKQKSRRKQRKEIEVSSPSSEIPNEERLPTTSNDPLPSGEDRMQHNELMILRTNLQKQVLDLEEAKTAQAKEIASLKKRVKKLKHKKKSRTSGLKRLRNVGSARRVDSSTEASLGDQEDASKHERMITNLDQDVEITLVDDTHGRMNEEDMFRVIDLDGDEMVVDVEQSDELTLAHTLIEIKTAKPKAITTAATTVTAAGTRPKEKRDYYELAARLQEEKREELSIEEKSRLFMELMDKRKKYFARLKAKRSKMLFNNTMKWIEAFVPIDTELVKGSEKAVEGSEKAEEDSSKRAARELEQEDAKRQRLEEENESGELKRCLEIIPEDDDDVTIEATPISSKSPTIVDYKVYKEGRKSYFKIIRADGNSHSYLTFGKMFKNFNREDLEVLWSIVKARFKKTKAIDDMDKKYYSSPPQICYLFFSKPLDPDQSRIHPTGRKQGEHLVDATAEAHLLLKEAVPTYRSESFEDGIELYMENKELGRMILESVKNDPLILPTIEENGVTRTKKYVELSATEKIQADCDVKATNIILQVLPFDIYALVNHHRVAKDLWERVQLLMQGGRTLGQQRVAKYFNYQREGHMARQCIEPKRKRDALCFWEKVLLVEAQGNAYQANDLDAYDSDCDDITTAKVALMANLSRYSSDVVSEIQRTSKLLEERQNVDLSTREKLIIDDFKKESLTTTFNVLKNGSKEKEDKNIDKEIALEKKVKELDNIVYKMGQSAQTIRLMLYHGNVISKETNVISIADSEETLMLEEESRSKMLLKQNIVNIVVNSSVDINASVNVDVSKSNVNECNKCLKLETELLKKKDFIEKEIYDKLSRSYSTLEKHCISLEVAIQLNQEIFQRDDTLWGIVKQAKAIQPLNNALDFAYKHAKRIQELLVYVRDTFSSAIKPSAKKVIITSKNKDKKVRFAKPITSASTNQKTQDSNKPLLHSTRVKCSTSGRGSKPSSNTKNNRISQPSSSNMINKVEDQPKSVKSRKNKKNCVNKTKCTAHVMQSMFDVNSVFEPISNGPVKHFVKNAKSKFLCAICNKFLIDSNHDMCFYEFVSKMNVCPKSKSAKKNKMHNVWKPTGKVFTKIVLWYLDSGCSKHITRNRSQLTNLVHKFLGTVKFDNEQIAKIMGYGDYQIGNVTISRVYYVEGLGHNIFSVASVASPVPAVEAPVPIESTEIPLGAEEESHDLEVAHMSNDPYFGIPIPETISEEPLSSDVISTSVHSDVPISKHLSKWTKDHPLQNIIGELSRPVSTRLQLYEQALFCYYDAFLTSVKPKTYKDALTQSCWIKEMQEELNEFERFKVWKLVPRLDKVMVITLKWIYK
nr:hypothetical protein [Tanacetum cinerariifolium]